MAERINEDDADEFEEVVVEVHRCVECGQVFIDDGPCGHNYMTKWRDGIPFEKNFSPTVERVVKKRRVRGTTCPDCGEVIGGYPFGKPYRCGEHTSIIEYSTDEECDECGEPFLPGYGIQNMGKTHVLNRPAVPSCDCPGKP